MRSFVLAAIVFTSIAAAPASQPATTQAAPDGFEPPKIYRMHAGQPGRDKWYAARSTGGGFTVSTPTSFNDITVSRRDADGTRVVTHMVGTNDSGGARFSASASTSEGVKLPPDAIASYVKMLAKPHELRQQHTAKLDGADATEFDVAKEKTVARYRVAQRDDVIYSLRVEGPGQVFPPATEAMARKFFDSFCFPTPEPNNGPASTASAAAPTTPATTP